MSYYVQGTMLWVYRSIISVILSNYSHEVGPHFQGCIMTFESTFAFVGPSSIKKYLKLYSTLCPFFIPIIQIQSKLDSSL